MHRFRKSFIYGAVVTSVFFIVLIHIYGSIRDSGVLDSRAHHHLMPRHGGPYPPAPQNSEQEHEIFLNTTHSEIDLMDLNQLAIVRNPEDQRTRDEGYRNYAFNLLISDRIGFHRNLPDTRQILCHQKTYSPDLPSASIIICFYNEAWSALLRTVHSVIDRTPAHLLHEIILVDDSSDFSHLGTDLQDYLTDHVPAARLIRTPSRQGLIRARIMGADHASGKVIVFLDSHCEVNVDWLEPLLSRVREDRRNVVIPIIDIIDMDTMKYQASPLVRGGFNWGMFFRWDQIPSELLRTKEDYVRPIRSPTMAGGLFAIDREYFIQMGKYDQGLDIWGGENLEISFRIWQCGGKLEIIPCSRVGHLFRKRRPYGDPLGSDTMTRNSLRVVNVWLDEYKEYFFQIRPEARKIDYGDISDRVALRRHLQCKSFKWYLETVYPEQTLPSEVGGGVVPRGQPARGVRLPKPIIKRKGFLYQRDLALCVLAADGPSTKRSLLKLGPCGGSVKPADLTWSETDNGAFQLALLLCLDYEEATQGRSYPRLMKCHFSGGSQGWIWNKTQLFNPASGKCLSSEHTDPETYMTVEICNPNDIKQHFKLTTSTET